MAYPTYRLPFDASIHPVTITQGRNGPWSHLKYDRRDASNAVDFGLPVGSDVFAARSGRVISPYFHTSDSYYDGTDPEIGRNFPGLMTNMTVVLHKDGTRAFYIHLAKGGIHVALNQHVSEGDRIATTGLSGWVGSHPHLHFEVQSGGGTYLSLPVTFKDYRGPLEHDEIYPPHLGKER